MARASTVAISLFVPLFVNSFFIDNGFCRGSPNDPSPELKKECRAAYVLASMLTGVAQLMGLLAAPVFGYLSSRVGAGSHGGGTGIAAINWPVAVATVFGVIGYIAFPRLPSPEPSDKDGRGGSPVVFLIVSLLGISQIGAIVCSLGSLGRGVLAADQDSAAVTSAADVAAEAGLENGQDVVDNGDDLTSTPEDAPLLPHTGAPTAVAAIPVSSRIRLKGSIAGVYSLCGGAAILLLTKLGGYLFDSLAKGAPFYMMAIFNAVLLAVSLAIDLAHVFRRKA